MIKKLWKILKDNFTVILGIITAITTCTYSFLKLLMHVYWSGYFHELNIDTSFMKLSYDGFVFQVIFIVTMLCAVMFLMYLVENKFKNTWEEIKKQPGSIWNRSICFLIRNIINLLYSFVLLMFVNYPIGMALCTWNRIEFNWTNMISSVIALYAIEILFLISTQINNIGAQKEKRSIEKCIFVNVMLIVIMVCSLLAGAYCLGSQAVVSKKELKLIDGEMFAITYSDGDKYILHGVEINGETIVINRNEQKVINNIDVMCVSKQFKEILISD